MVMELSGAFQLGITRERSSKAANNMPPEFGSGWYFSRKELESISPSRKDGIDSKIESELRMRYCSFLKDFGMRLGAPQVTIATAIVFCHRFYLHQSHAKNDWKVMATVCMFLASKAEDTPLSLDKVVIAAYEMIHKRDPATASRIHQKDVFEKQKALILIGERLLLATIRSDFNVQHPYRPLLHALKKFGITQKDVRQVAWNFVNDSIQTTLCLQYKPHYIAAGSLFLAAKLHNVKLPAEKGHMWWHEFDVTPQQLNAAIQDMMELPGCKKRPTTDCPLEKQAPVTSKTKEEISSSPESCVLSRPGSSRSSSSQFPDGEANGGQMPKDISVPNNTSKQRMDIQHPSAVRTEVQCQARDSKSKSSIIDDCQGSDECIDQAATTGPKNISAPTITSMPIMDIQHPYVVRTEVQCPVRDSKNKSSITDDCQGSAECMDQATTRPELALVADCLKSGEGINRATSSMLEKANCHGSDERLDKTTARSEHALEVEDFKRSGEGIDSGTTTVLEKAALIEHCQGTVEDVNQAALPNLEQYAEYQHYQIPLDRETIMSEKAAIIEHCQGMIEGVIQEGPNPEESFGDQDCQKPVDVDQERADPEQAADVEDCEGFGEDVEQSRGEPASQLYAVGVDQERTVPSSQLYVEGVDQARTEPAHFTGLDQARAEPAHFTETEIHEGSSHGLDQSGAEPACLLYVVGNVDHQARSDPDEVPSTEVSKDSVKGMMHPPKAEPEQVEDRLGKVDMDRIRALRRKKRERETNHRSGASDDVSGNVDEGIETVHKIRSKPEQADVPQGSGHGERGQVEGIAKLDTARIKALMLKRKRERESKMARDTNNVNEDAWIERELEAGIEFTADCSQKKRRLS